MSDSVIGYPMRHVTRTTGLTAHTVRVWERRYGAVSPRRTAGGARRYTDADIGRLCRLVEATERGYSIGSVAGLSDEELDAVLARSPAGADTTPLSDVVHDYLDAIATFDPGQSSEILSRAATLLPARTFVLETVLPILRQTGDRWEAGRFSVAQEHLVSGQIRALLGTLYRPASRRAPLRVIFGTPAGHRHEFGALAAAGLAATMGVEVVYLGPDLPDRALEHAVRTTGARVLAMSVLRSLSPDEAVALARTIRNLRPLVPCWLGLPAGHPAAASAAAAGGQIFHTYPPFERALEARMSARPAPGQE